MFLVGRPCRQALAVFVLVAFLFVSLIDPSEVRAERGDGFPLALACLLVLVVQPPFPMVPSATDAIDQTPLRSGKEISYRGQSDGLTRVDIELAIGHLEEYMTPGLQRMMKGFDWTEFRRRLREASVDPPSHPKLLTRRRLSPTLGQAVDHVELGRPEELVFGEREMFEAVFTGDEGATVKVRYVVTTIENPEVRGRALFEVVGFRQNLVPWSPLPFTGPEEPTRDEADDSWGLEG